MGSELISKTVEGSSQLVSFDRTGMVLVEVFENILPILDVPPESLELYNALISTSEEPVINPQWKQRTIETNSPTSIGVLQTGRVIGGQISTITHGGAVFRNKGGRTYKNVHEHLDRIKIELC